MDYRSEPLTRYLDDASAAKPTPGGGSVAAIAGALASTMASMAANFTTGKERFKEVEAEIAEALGYLEESRTKLVDLAHEDMDAYTGITQAYRMRRGTDDEKAARDRAIQEAIKGSLGVVEGVLESCRDVLVATLRLAGIANPNLISDVGVAAELALGAAKAARVNVLVNLVDYTDEAEKAAVRQRADRVVEQSEQIAEEIRQAVAEKLGA
jgi:formiminotetrahydrofolate cyclodeaminase